MVRLVRLIGRLVVRLGKVVNTDDPAPPAAPGA